MEPELKEEYLGSCWLLKVLKFIPLLSRIPADSTTYTMGGQMDTRESPLLMGQIIPRDAKEQGFLLTGDVPWTRFPGGLLLPGQLHGGPQACLTYPVTS